MRRIKSGRAEIEEHWIDVGWYNGPGSTFAGNWMVRPLTGVYTAPRFPKGVGPIFELGKDTSGGGRQVDGVLWMMIGGTMQGNYANLTHPEWMLLSPGNWNNDTVKPGGNTYGLDLSDPECVSWMVDWVADTMAAWNYVRSSACALTPCTP